MPTKSKLLLQSWPTKSSCPTEELPNGNTAICISKVDFNISKLFPLKYFHLNKNKSLYTIQPNRSLDLFHFKYRLLKIHNNSRRATNPSTSLQEFDVLIWYNYKQLHFEFCCQKLLLRSYYILLFRCHCFIHFILC
jgi:hypothetical protein